MRLSDGILRASTSGSVSSASFPPSSSGPSAPVPRVVWGKVSVSDVLTNFLIEYLSHAIKEGLD